MQYMIVIVPGGLLLINLIMLSSATWSEQNKNNTYPLENIIHTDIIDLKLKIDKI